MATCDYVNELDLEEPINCQAIPWSELMIQMKNDFKNMEKSELSVPFHGKSSLKIDIFQNI